MGENCTNASKGGTFVSLYQYWRLNVIFIKFCCLIGSLEILVCEDKEVKW